MNRILQDITDSFSRLLEGNLVGAYVHGSIAFGCYHSEKSDIDLLIVVREAMDMEKKGAVLAEAYRLHRQVPGNGLELSVVLLEDCVHFTYPTPYELHFSKYYEERYRRDPAGFCAGMKGTDIDLAAHFTVVRSVGYPLCGPPVEEVFGEVPAADYIDSIREDVAGAVEDILRNPVYVALNLCRVLAAVEKGLVLSKEQGGRWALERLDGNHAGLVRQALECYAGGTDWVPEAGEAREFGATMLERIFKMQNR